MTLRRFRTLALIALVSQCLISVTGAAVRLTGSGLGCSQWPTCENGNLVAPWEFHAQVEFINRLITGVVSLSAGAALIGAFMLRPRDPRFVRWSSMLVAGIFAQALVGAMVTKSDLLPNWVAVHFLLSAVLVSIATVQLAQATDRLAETDSESNEQAPRSSAATAAPRWQRAALAAATAGVLVTGPIVTGTGPHAGDENARRWQLALTTITRTHSITAWLLVAVVCWISWTALARIRVNARGDQSAAFAAQSRTTGAIRAALVTLCLQGAVGYLQYATKLPPLLVGIHVAGAMGTIVAVTWLAHYVTPGQAPLAASLEPGSSDTSTLGNGAHHDAAAADRSDERPDTVTA